MKNHFRLSDYCLDTIDKPLSKNMMIKMNKILMRNTTDEENPRYNVGVFKIEYAAVGENIIVQMPDGNTFVKENSVVKLLLE